MLKLQYTASAEADIEDLVEFGIQAHGEEAVIRYNRLIQFSVEELRQNPQHDRAKSISKGIKMVHLRYFKQDVFYEGVSVQEPSHLIFYRVLDDDIFEVVRILHEARDFLRHLQ